jgi:HKD family nuclease
MIFIENNRRTLLGELRELLHDADDALFAVAYVRSSAIRLIRRSLEAIRERHGTCRVLFALRPPVSDAAAIRALMNLGAHIRCYDAPHVFHIKAYIIRNRAGTSAIIGSANLSGSALTLGREWCLVGDRRELPIEDMRAEFEHLWSSRYATDITEDHLKWLEAHAKPAELRAIGTREDEIAPTSRHQPVNEEADYVVRRHEDHTSRWWYQIYEGRLAEFARRGSFNVVVIGDLDADSERRFVIPYDFLRTDVLPFAGRDPRRRRYLFTVDKRSFEFRWTGGFSFDGGQFVA